MAILRPRVPDEAAEYAANALPRVLATAYRLTGNRADAEDLAQDVLTAVLTKWERIRRADSVDGYVRAMLVNRFISTRRRAKLEPVLLATPGEQRVAPPSPDDWNPDHDPLWSGLSTLSARGRAVLVLRYYEDLPDPTIAAIIGCAPATVRSLAFRALAELRANLDVRGLVEPAG